MTGKVWAFLFWLNLCLVLICIFGMTFAFSIKAYDAAAWFVFGSIGSIVAAIYNYIQLPKAPQ